MRRWRNDVGDVVSFENLSKGSTLLPGIEESFYFCASLMKRRKKTFGEFIDKFVCLGYLRLALMVLL